MYDRVLDVRGIVAGLAESDEAEADEDADADADEDRNRDADAPSRYVYSYGTAAWYCASRAKISGVGPAGR